MNISNFAQPVRVGNFSSAPADVSAGAMYWDTTSNSLQVANGSSYSGAGGNSFLSGVFRVQDSSDPTKQLAFNVSSFTTGTTRTITVPNAPVDLGNLTNSNISASAGIVYSKLSLSNSILNADINSSAGIVYSKLSLANSIINSDINSSAAIAYSKLNLSGSIVNADIASAAAIAVNKLAAVTANRALQSDASGFVSASSVTSTTLGFLDATSSVQTQLNATEKTANKGQPNGYASLDGGGKVPLAQLPATVLEYLGTWDASTNTPTLADGTGVSGQFYITNVAGTQNLGSGSQTFAVGDWVMYDGSIWERVINSNAVASVNGSTGAVTVNAINQLTGDVTAGPASGSQSKAATIAAGAVTASKLGSVTDGLTLDQSGSGSTLEVKAGGISNTQVSSSAAIAYSKLALSNSIVNADIASAAAIAYSKLNLSASVKASDMNSQSATNGQVLTANGSGGATYTTIAASGNVSGPGSSTNNALVRWDGTTGQLIKDSTTLDFNSDFYWLDSTLYMCHSNYSRFAQFQYYHNIALTASSTTQESNISFQGRTGFKGVQVLYVIKNGNDQRFGTLRVVANGTTTGGSVTSAAIDDNYVQTADINLTWSVAVSGDNINVSYTTGSGTYAANYSITKLQPQFDF